MLGKHTTVSIELCEIARVIKRVLTWLRRLRRIRMTRRDMTNDGATEVSYRERRKSKEDARRRNARVDEVG